MKSKVLLACLAIFSLQACEKSDLSQLDNNIISTNKNLATNDLPLTPNGSETFTQVPWADNYVIPGESTPIPGDHTLSTPNPILSEQNRYSDYVSNVPLDLEVVNNNYGGDWYQRYTYKFTNRSTRSFHLDSGVIMFVAPNNSNADRAYHKNGPHGHPQQDYVEVPIVGTPNSWYIARLVFHDVPEFNRSIAPGETWSYIIGTPTNPFDAPNWITTEESKKTVRFIADLTGNKNEDMVRKYGTKRFRN